MNYFSYDKKIDTWSHKMVGKLHSIWGRQLFKTDENSSVNITLALRALDNFLESHGLQIIERLNKIYNLEYQLSDFGFFVNTSPVSLDSHKKGNFFISISINRSLSKCADVIIHELSHIYFYAFMYKYFKKSWIGLELHVGKYRLGEGELNELKEVVTVINNIEFSSILTGPDIGYPKHKVLRDRILYLWTQKKKLRIYSGNRKII